MVINKEYCAGPGLGFSIELDKWHFLRGIKLLHMNASCRRDLSQDHSLR